MPEFSDRSKLRLLTCHYNLRSVFNEVIQHYDCTILEGHRGQEAQDEAVRRGTSQVSWPNGNHNSVPSRAIDVAPYPIEWEGEAALKRFHVFAGYVLGTADQMGIALRWGGDWDRDWEFTDQSFHDLPHFELIDPQ